MMSITKRRFITMACSLMLALILTTAGCGSDAEQAASPADFYRGKTINLIVASSAGGRTDLCARVIASYLERDTGANVLVTIQRGAGGLDGMNYIYRSEPDGLTLGAVSSSKFVPNKVMDEPAAVYEIEEFSYIMEVGHEIFHLFVSPDGPYQSVADLQAGTDLLIGGSSPSGPVSLGGLTVIELLDLDAKVVTGLSGVSDRALAAVRGEIVGYVSTITTVGAPSDSSMVIPIFALATERDSLAPDVPAISELVSLSDEDLALVRLWETYLASSDMLAAPAGLPEDRLAFLRGLADDWIQEEEFREEMNIVFGYEVQAYRTGDEVAESMINIATSMDKFRALFAELIEKYRA